MLSKQVDRIKINLNNFKIYILRKKNIYIHTYIHIYIYGWIQVTSGVILNNITPPNNLL